MNIPKGYKQTEVGIIPENWENMFLGEILEFKNGLNKGKSYFGYGNPIINYTDVYHKNGIRLSDVKGKVSLSLDEIRRFQVKMGDVFFTRTSETPEEVGYAAVLLEDIPNCSFSGFVLRGRPKSDELLKEYCVYCFQTKNFRNEVINSCTYTTRALTNGRVLSAISIPIPPIDEQKAIANILFDIDKLIAGLGEQIEKKRQIKEGAMQQLLTGKTRLPGFTQPWHEVQIGKIGYTYPGITGKTKDDFNRGDARYITFLNVLNNPVIDTSIFERVNISPTEGQNAVHKGDLFFNTSSETPEEVGICAVLNEEIEDLYLNSFCFGYRLTDDSILGHYLAYFWRSKRGREIMTSLAQGATRYNLSKAYFNKVNLTIPQTKDEQIAIVDVLNTMDDEICQLEAERDKYTLIKQGMMQELLTGKIRLV